MSIAAALQRRYFVGNRNGDNYIPTIHVRDLARAVKFLSTAPEVIATRSIDPNSNNGEDPPTGTTDTARSSGNTTDSSSATNSVLNGLYEGGGGAEESADPNDNSAVAAGGDVEVPMESTSYIIAVDQSNTTVKDFINCVSTNMGLPPVIPTTANQDDPSSIAAAAESILTATTTSSSTATTTPMDIFNIDLRFKPSSILTNYEFNWYCKDGINKNINNVLKQFIEARALKPFKVHTHA